MEGRHSSSVEGWGDTDEREREPISRGHFITLLADGKATSRDVIVNVCVRHAMSGRRKGENLSSIQHTMISKGHEEEGEKPTDQGHFIVWSGDRKATSVDVIVDI